MSFIVLDLFPKLICDRQAERLEAAYRLIAHCNKELEENGQSKEYGHVLNRFVRGLGSSKVASRKGFYTVLTVFLADSDIEAEKILEIMDHELKTSASSSKGEVGDVHNGRILTCGAIIRSKIFLKYSVDNQKKILEYLIHSGKKRSYLNFEAVSFIVELLKLYDDEEKLKPLWPMLEPEICKSVKELTLDTFYVLLVVQDKFPGLLFKKLLIDCFGSEDIINEESIKEFLKILTNIPRVISYKHPVYKIFCERLAGTEYIEQFWNGVDQCFIKPSKTDEYLGVELFNLLLQVIQNKSTISVLLSPNFLKYMLKRFSNNARQKSDDVAEGFRNGFTQLVKVLDKDVKTKVHIAVIKKLILYPGDLLIEKITGTKVLQKLTNNLNADGVKKLSKIYREIAANTKLKEKPNSEPEPWKNAERTYAIQMLSVKLMSHPEITSDHEWRIEQLKFLFNLGLCEVSNVGVELAPHIKESFFRALDHKLPKLDNLRTVLSSVIAHIDESVFKTSSLTLKSQLDEPATEAWKNMIKHVKKLEKDSDTDNISAVFHTMNLHMGLQLFTDPEMAVSSINELHSCYEHVKAKKKSQKKNNGANSEDEPEWVEVVVDLLLSLLSRKSHLLRSLVGCVFPHICPHITAGALHQILATLDVKSGKNPLSISKEGDEPESEESSNDEESEEEDEDNSDEENDEEIDEESDSDVEDPEEEEEDPYIDMLRMAVSRALGSNAMQTDDEDIDVDDIDEEEGMRLNKSLGEAFKILRESRKSYKKKQEKSATALTHFRIRVIDLLETYLESNPPMALVLDMLVPLCSLLEFAIKEPHQKPLEDRVRTSLRKLANVKKFKDTKDVDEELLSTILKALVEKGDKSTAICHQMSDKLAECCVFLVKCSQQTNVATDSFIKIFSDSLNAYFRNRDCILPSALFKSVLQINWSGNWCLAALLVDHAFDQDIRPFRRGEALSFLKIFHSNMNMIKTDDHEEEKCEMEKKLCKSALSVLEASSISQTENGKNARKDTKQKYICYLFNLLHTIYPHHSKKAWDWNKIAKSIAKYRSTVTLAKDAKKAYNKLANRIGAPIVVPREQASETNRLSNGNQDNESLDNSSDSENEDTATNGNSESPDVNSKKNDKKRKKNSGKTKEKQQLKKTARELREKAMSEGLETFDFSSVNLPYGDGEELLQNGDTEEENTPEKSKKAKRTNTDTPDVPNKKKKKAM